MELIFKKQEFLYNNGIVNFCIYLSKILGKDLDIPVNWEYKNVTISLSENHLLVSGEINEIDKLFMKVRENISSDYLCETEKLRLWWDRNNNNFVCAPKINSPKKKNLNLNIMQDYSYKLTNLNTDYQKMIQKEQDAIRSYKEIYGKLFDHKPLDAFWGEDKREFVYGSFNFEEIKNQKLNESFQGVEFPKNTKCAICKILPASIKADTNTFFYEIGESSFSDLRKGGEKLICRYCNLIYDLSKFYYYFYIHRIDSKKVINNHFYINHSSSLRSLLAIKKKLQIVNGSTEETKDGKSIPTNIKIPSYVNKLCAGGVYTKAIILLFSIYQKIKDSKTQDDFLTVENIRNFNIYAIEDDGTFLTKYNNLNRLDRIFLLFDSLHEKEFGNEQNNDYKSAFDVLVRLLMNMSLTNKDDKGATLINKFIFNLLNFNKSIMQDIKQNSEQALKNNTGGVRYLEKFIEVFQDEINSTDKEKLLHIIASEIGKRIGRVAFVADSKDLLYRIREIGNLKGFPTFFEEFTHRVLKITKEDPKTFINAEFKEKEEFFLRALSPKNWKEARAYLSIYAINNYLANKSYSAKSE